jgi:mono/diheme cytochrome c family protein
VVLAGLETSHKIGILVAAGVFIAFALLSSFVFPKMNPNFPGKSIAWFVAASIGLTVLMLGTIIVLAKEPAEERGNEAAAAVDTTANETPQAPKTTTEAAVTTEEAGTTEEAETTEAPETTEEAAAGDPAAGKQVFASAGCASCHTLQDAGAQGTVGPNLDEAKPSRDLVVERVTNGKPPMPAFKGTLSDEQIQDVAAYVSSVAGT